MGSPEDEEDCDPNLFFLHFVNSFCPVITLLICWKKQHVPRIWSKCKEILKVYKSFIKVAKRKHTCSYRVCWASIILIRIIKVKFINCFWMYDISCTKYSWLYCQIFLFTFPCTVLLYCIFFPFVFILFMCERRLGEMKNMLHTFPPNQMLSDYEANISTGLSWLRLCKNIFSDFIHTARWVIVINNYNDLNICNCALTYSMFWLLSFVWEFLLFLPPACAYISLHIHRKELKAPFLLEALSLSDIDPVSSVGITIETSWCLDIESHQIYIKGPHRFEDLAREMQEETKKIFFHMMHL